MLGIYLSGHPLDKSSELLSKYISNTISQLAITEDSEVYEGQKVIIGGMVVNERMIFTKNNKKMAFITLEDTTGDIECVVFPNVYDQWVKFDKTDTFILDGHISIKGDDITTIIINKITTLEEKLNKRKNTLLLILSKVQQTKEIRAKLIEIFNFSKGNIKVGVQTLEDGVVKLFPDRYNIDVTPSIINELEKLIGKDNVLLPKI